MKQVQFHGRSLDDLRGFPETARRQAGYQIERLQSGLEPDDWKPMRTIGDGACEIRVRDTSGAYRVVYVAKWQDAIHVLHAFQKKSAGTTKRDIDIAALRYRAIVARRVT